MFEFHTDRKRYFDIQAQNATRFVIPFIEEKFAIVPGMRVLEIGCGEGGVLKAFVDRGCIGVGVELLEERLENGRQWVADELASGQITFILRNIYDIEPEKDLGGSFDLIVLKDVIEHIPDQQKLMHYMQAFLKDTGAIFFGFPPWQMPLGGHQQINKGKFLSRLPYYHLLPTPIYKWILKSNGEPWPDLLEIKETGISIERFERIAQRAHYKIINKTHYLINPIYEYKFGWKPRRQFAFISSIPWFRNFVTSCVYYLIAKKQ